MTRIPVDFSAGLTPETFARLEVCLLAFMHRLSDDQVLELADTLHHVIRMRRRHPADASPHMRERRWTPRTPDGKVVDLWPEL